MPFVGAALLAGYVFGALRFRADRASRTLEIDPQTNQANPVPPTFDRVLLWPYYAITGKS